MITFIFIGFFMYLGYAFFITDYFITKFGYGTKSFMFCWFITMLPIVIIADILFGKYLHD